MALMNQNTSITASPLKMEIQQSRGQVPSARNSSFPGRDLEGGVVSTHLVLPLIQGEVATTVTEELKNKEAEV